MAQDETRGAVQVQDAEGALSQGRNLLVVIGIDAYTYWPKLRNAVSDALGVQKLFVEKLGFTMLFPPLLNADATADNILALITDKLPGALHETDNLVFFYAGHGNTRVSKIPGSEIENGYLIPVDAKLENWADKIRTDDFLENLSQLPAHHVLLIIDACRSGFALSGMKAHRSAISYQETLSQNVSRKVISSARRDEDALDSGPMPQHSLFTGTLIEGLNWGAADLDRNGLVTSYELGLYLQQRVGQASDSKQTPDFGSFGLDDRGELVISLRDDTFDAVKARAFGAMLNHDADALTPLVTQLNVLRADAAETLYLQFRLLFMQDDYDGALATLTRLSQMNFDDGAIPLTRGDVSALLVQLAYWKPILELTPSSLPVNVTMQIETRANEFENAPRVAFGADSAFQVQVDAVARYQAENTSDANAHLYFITILPNGRLLVGPLLEDEATRIDGLAPGAKGAGRKFQVKGLPGIIEMRIVYAPQRFARLLFPEMVAARALDVISPETVAALKSQTLFYEIVSQDVGAIDAMSIRNVFGSLLLDVKPIMMDAGFAKDIRDAYSDEVAGAAVEIE